MTTTRTSRLPERVRELRIPVRWRPLGRATVFVLLLSVFGAACSDQQPDSSTTSGAAYDMSITSEGTCQSDEPCLMVEISNLGEVAGNGECVVNRIEGNDVIAVAARTGRIRLSPGEVVKSELPLAEVQTNDTRNQRLSINCDPGRPL